MDAKTRRVMKAKQGKVTTESGSPGEAEGYEGQVQVRDTSDGPMLFAKFKGRWIKVPLGGREDSVPRIWSIPIVLPSASSAVLGSVPKFIDLDNILHIALVINITGETTSNFYQSVPENSGASTAFAIRVVIITQGRSINVPVIATLYQGMKARLTIFYK